MDFFIILVWSLGLAILTFAELQVLRKLRDIESQISIIKHRQEQHILGKIGDVRS